MLSSEKIMLFLLGADFATTSFVIILFIITLKSKPPQKIIYNVHHPIK